MRSCRSGRSWRSLAASSCRSWRSRRSRRSVSRCWVLSSRSACSWRLPRSSRTGSVPSVFSATSALGAPSARVAEPAARPARRGGGALAGPLSPFWRALMAATRSPLRILAVPLMPMLEASPWSSASRMAVNAPERRGLAPDVASRVVVSVTKDPSPRSWMASMWPIMWEPTPDAQRMAGRRPWSWWATCGRNREHPASAAVARHTVAPHAGRDARPAAPVPKCAEGPVSRARAPRRGRRAAGCRGSAPATPHHRRRAPRRPGAGAPARARRAPLRR